jgi:hypothetical protein
MRHAAFALLCMFATMPALAESSPAVDVALVFAVDVSGSVTDDSWQLQREGIASAIAGDEFARARRAGATGRVAIAIVQFGTEARAVIGWRVIESAHGAQVVAAEIRAMARTESGSTCIAKVLAKAVEVLVEWTDHALRRVIDVSGDGSENCRGDVAGARAAAIGAGITINGLPIVTRMEPWIASWYERDIIGGPNAFMIVADGHQRFAEAFRRKLIMEIADAAPVTLRAY